MSNFLQAPSLAGFTREHLLDLIIQNELKFNSNGDTGLYTMMEEASTDNFIITRRTPSGDTTIFTLTPDGELTISGDITMNSNDFTISSGAFNSNIRMDNNGGSGIVMRRQVVDGNVQVGDVTNNSADLILLAGGSEAMRVIDGGNVDISNGNLTIDSGGVTDVDLLMNTTNSTGRVLAREDGGNVFIGDLVSNGGELFLFSDGGSGLKLDTLQNVQVFNKMIVGTPIPTTPTIDLAIGDSDTGLNQEAEDTLAVYTGGTERMRIVANGDIGMGTNDPGDARLHIVEAANGRDFSGVYSGVHCIIEDTEDSVLLLSGGNTSNTEVWFGDTDSDTSGRVRYEHNNNKMEFYTNGGLQATISSGGNFGIGGNAANVPSITLAVGDNDTGIDWNGQGDLSFKSNGTEKIRIEGGANGDVTMISSGTGNVGIGLSDPATDLEIEALNPVLRIADSRTNLASAEDLCKISFWSNDSPSNICEITAESINGTTNPDGAFRFDMYLNSSINGVVRFENNGDVNNSTGTYGTISDRRLKENIVDAGSQWDDIKNIRFRKFNFIGKRETFLGVVADELELTSPNLINKNEEQTQTINGIDLLGVKSVKQSILMMKGMVALQEALTRIEELEARVEALENP